MGALFSLIGLVFLLSGLLSIVNLTDVGLNFVEQSQIHTLPFLADYPSSWIYIALGLLCLIIASAFRRRRR